MRLSLLCFCLLLTACGFTLRGFGDSAELAPALQTMYLSGSTGNDVLMPIRSSLQASGVTLLEEPRADAVILQVGDERSHERIVSLDSSARAGEFALNMAVNVTLSRGDTLLLGPEDLLVEQIYVADPGNAIAKAEEAEIIQREMRRDIARQLLLRLENLPLAEAPASPPPSPLTSP